MYKGIKISLINTEDFEDVQEYLLSCGVRWRSGKPKVFHPEHAGFIGLTIGKDGKMMYHTSAKEFQRDENEEMTYVYSKIRLVAL